MGYLIGQSVIPKNSDSVYVIKEVTRTPWEDTLYRCTRNDGLSRLFYGYELTPALSAYQQAKLKEETIMTKIVSKIKRLTLSKGERLLRKYEIVDESGDLTDDGREVINAILLDEYREKLIAKVTELDKEEREEKRRK